MHFSDSIQNQVQYFVVVVHRLQEHTTEFVVSARTTPNDTSCGSAAGEIIPSLTEESTTQEHKWKDPLHVDILTEQRTGLRNGPVVVDIEDSPEQDGTGHQVCGSSVSSETSTKSTDNLLHLTNGGLSHC